VESHACWPALATVGIFTFTVAWNQFIWPLLIMSKDSMKTLQVGLQVFQTQYTTTWDLLMAATVVLTVPVLVIFVFGQRCFTRGIALSEMKGQYLYDGRVCRPVLSFFP